MQRNTLVAAAIAFCGLIVSEAIARPNYPGRVPTPFSCSTCHLNPAGAGPRNPFGIDFPMNGHTWAAVCELDSDMDGAHNGAELGDPDCVWMPGDPLPDFPATRPGDPEDTPPPPPPEPEPMPEGEPDPMPEPMPEGEPAPQPEPMPEGEPAPQPEPMPEGEPAPQPEGEPAPQPEGEPAPQPAAEPAPQPEGEPEASADMGTDDGGDADDSDDGGCDTTNGTTTAPLFALALLFGLRRRRRG